MKGFCMFLFLLLRAGLSASFLFFAAFRVQLKAVRGSRGFEGGRRLQYLMKVHFQKTFFLAEQLPTTCIWNENIPVQCLRHDQGWALPPCLKDKRKGQI